METKIKEDFQICISVPLRFSMNNIEQKSMILNLLYFDFVDFSNSCQLLPNLKALTGTNYLA